MQEPLITVVTASFNALDGLRTTVGSVAEQTFRSVEHVIIDGGSTDGTQEYLEGLGEKVRWVSEPDEGIADAMNKGIAMARGEWVLVLQAGDTFHQVDSLERTVPQLDDSMLVGFAVEFRYPDRPPRKLSPRAFSTVTKLRMLVPHQGLFTRKSLFDSIGYYDQSISVYMDYDHLLRAQHAGHKMKAVDEVLSIMPADGVSSREDWPSRIQRLNEQFRVQWTNAPHAWHRLTLLGFWAIFYPTYCLKNLIAPKFNTY